IKENSIQGNYATAMVFDTRANGGNQTEQMRINSAGNLGIGTSNPAHKLDVAGDINALTSGTTTAIVGTNTGTANDGVDGIATNAAGTGAGVYGESDSNAGYGVLGYAGATSGTTYGVYGAAVSSNGVGVYGQGVKWAGYFMGNVFDSGNVGIGTLTPVHRLDVAGDINALTGGTTSAIVGTNMGTANDGVDGLATNAAGTGAGVYGESDSNAGYGVFGYSGAASGTTYGVYGAAVSTGGVGVYGQGGKWAGYFSGDVYSSGHVGIGTATPSANLEVNGTAKFDGVVTFAGGQSFPHVGVFNTTTLYNNFPGSSPSYIRIDGISSASANETLRDSLMPSACTAGNLNVVLSSPASLIVVLRLNGSSTALGCTISGGTGCTDAAHSVAVTPGSLLSIQLLGGSTGNVVYTAFTCG
ncbi:MAG TPA: hypothetical protein VG028_15845, partial [Terriglobia bacterium]|nr:hypothetical protein [Terriglobia bacterium]